MTDERHEPQKKAPISQVDDSPDAQDTKSVTFRVRMSVGTRQRLEELAEARSLTASEMVRLLIDQEYESLTGVIIPDEVAEKLRASISQFMAAMVDEEMKSYAKTLAGVRVPALQGILPQATDDASAQDHDDEE